MIECLKFKAVEKGSLIGFADFFIPKTGMELYGCTMHSKNGGKWVNLPAKEYEINGERKFSSVARFRERSHQDAFSKQAIEAIERWIEKNPSEDTSRDVGECPF